MEHYFPEDLRPATVAEREAFYREEFPADEVEFRMGLFDRFIPVIDVGTETTRYRPRLKAYKGKLVRLSPVENAEALRQKLIEYAPEDVYYVRTVEREDRVEVNPRQELVFEMRATEVPSKKARKYREHIDEQWHEFVFTMDCFEAVASKAKELHAFLGRHFDHLRIVYTGVGFQIHVEDEAGFELEMEDRREFAQKVWDRFPIKREVTAGETDIVRLPGSLHGVVSRKAIDVTPDALEDPAAILERARPVSF